MYTHNWLFDTIRVLKYVLEVCSISHGVLEVDMQHLEVKNMQTTCKEVGMQHLEVKKVDV